MGIYVNWGWAAAGVADASMDVFWSVVVVFLGWQLLKWLATTLTGNVVGSLVCCWAAYYQYMQGDTTGTLAALVWVLLSCTVTVVHFRERLADMEEQRAWEEEEEGTDVELFGPDGRPLAQARAWVADTYSGECLDCRQEVLVQPARCPRCGGEVH